MLTVIVDAAACNVDEMKLHVEEFHELYFRCSLLGRPNEGDACHM